MFCLIFGVLECFIASARYCMKKYNETSVIEEISPNQVILMGDNSDMNTDASEI